MTGAMLVLILGMALLLSILLTRRYAAPILRGLHNIREGQGTSTNVQEIDELVKFLKSREDELLRQQEMQSMAQTLTVNDIPKVDISAYRTFIDQIVTLSKAERLVFNLYVKEMTSREIAQQLNLSINTIRTHNRNIYAKLNVSSYKELMVYIRIMTGADSTQNNI